VSAAILLGLVLLAFAVGRFFARLLAGPDFGRLLPVAMLLGAGYLLGVDTLARTVARIEIPIGVLTAFIGTPFFIWLLAASRRSWR
jgi:iron complex transport system permease protein